MIVKYSHIEFVSHHYYVINGSLAMPSDMVTFGGKRSYNYLSHRAIFEIVLGKKTCYHI